MTFKFGPALLMPSYKEGRNSVDRRLEPGWPARDSEMMAGEYAPSARYLSHRSVTPMIALEYVQLVFGDEEPVRVGCGGRRVAGLSLRNIWDQLVRVGAAAMDPPADEGH